MHALARGYISKLIDRTVHLFEGKDGPKLLQGITTNDIESFMNSSNTAISSLFLDPKGRILFESIIAKAPNFDRANPMFFIDVHRSVAELFTHHIEKYSFRKSVSLMDVSQNVEVQATYSDSLISDAAEGSPQRWSEIEEDPAPVEPDVVSFSGYSAFLDPRTRLLGARTICAANSLDLDTEIQQKSLDFYKAFRLLCGVCESPTISGQIPHLLGYHKLNSISFNKGCYVGQELIARTHTQGVLRSITLPFILSEAEVVIEGYLMPPIHLIDEGYKQVKPGKILNNEGAVIGQALEIHKNIGLCKISIERSSDIACLEDGSKIRIMTPVHLSEDH